MALSLRYFRNAI